MRRLDGGGAVSLADIATRSMCGTAPAMQATCSHSSPTSPPPFMVGMAEIELDPETGSVRPLEFVAVVDCGTPINPNLARIQTEGGLVQGIGMTLYENVTTNALGQIAENSFMQYKLPTRQDMGTLHVEFEPSYEPTGPFGAKSIGEIVINTPSPAIAHAIHSATGVWHRELPSHRKRCCWVCTINSRTKTTKRPPERAIAFPGALLCYACSSFMNSSPVMVSRSSR